MDNENIFVVTKEHATELLQDKTKYFTNKVSQNGLYLTAWFLICTILGLTCLFTAILLILTGPFFLIEYIIRKIFDRRKQINENDYAIDEE
jgi:hypothetical protein